MFGLKRKNTASAPVEQKNPAQLEQALAGTERSVFGKLLDHFAAGQKLDAEMLEEIEERLLTADVGIQTTQTITAALERHSSAGLDREGIAAVLKNILLQKLIPMQQQWVFADAAPKPHVILIVGVNGCGKTSAIGKLSHHLLGLGKTVQLAAGDTFRAAAVEQLREWGRRSNVNVTARQSGADPGAVIFDCLQSARANNIDIVIADTAGRLHTHINLMEQLKKIRRVINKFDERIGCETILTLDAGTGQNALVQAREFDNAVGIDSLILTKLDGTAKGGIVLALASVLAKPIRFVGVGEGINDLHPFTADEFVDALLAADS